MSVFKIRDKATGRFQSGTNGAFDAKGGRAWGSVAALCAHLRRNGLARGEEVVQFDEVPLDPVIVEPQIRETLKKRRKAK